ncbi:hypothetical protein LguiB_026492 [Lonicera macranthoides]
MTQPEELVHVCISVHKDAEGPFHSPSDCCIFRVHDHLRNLMEKHKRRYLELLLQRKNDHKEKYIDALRSLEGEVRRCYAEHLEQDANQLVYMMLLDGCFIVELREDNDNRDLPHKFKHLLGLVHNNWLPLFSMTKPIKSAANRKEKPVGYLTKKLENFKFICCAMELKVAGITFRQGKGNTVGYLTKKLENFKFIRCAMELKDAGIKFKQGKDGNASQIISKDMCFINSEPLTVNTTKWWQCRR